MKLDLLAFLIINLYREKGKRGRERERGCDSRRRDLKGRGESNKGSRLWGHKQNLWLSIHHSPLALLLTWLSPSLFLSPPLLLLLLFNLLINERNENTEQREEEGQRKKKTETKTLQDISREKGGLKSKKSLSSPSFTAQRGRKNTQKSDHLGVSDISADKDR